MTTSMSVDIGDHIYALRIFEMQGEDSEQILRYYKLTLQRESYYSFIHISVLCILNMDLWNQNMSDS